jgi:hypothetical protein
MNILDTFLELVRLYIERARLRRLLMERAETRESSHTWHDHDHPMIEYMNEDGMRTLARLLPFRGRDDGLDEEKEQIEEDTEVKEDKKMEN